MIHPGLLAKMADIINQKSTRYHAVVPSARHEYMVQQNDQLVRTDCPVLKIMLVGKTKCHKYRTIWTIFELDIDTVIRRMSLRDQAFANRMMLCEPTPYDVDILVRRASFRSLKLNLTFFS